jgi:flagellar biosynthetic protein FliR
MQDFFSFAMAHMFPFSLVFLRVSGLCVVAPIFGSDQVPKHIRVLLAMSLAFVLFPALQGLPQEMPPHALGYFLLVLKELVIGLMIGFLTTAIFHGFQMGGQFIAVDMGLAMGSMLDPFTNEQSSVLGQFFGMLTLIVFLVMNGHHFILRALYDSFRYVPPLSAVFRVDIFEYALQVFNVVVVTSLKVVMPMLAALFVINVVFGFIARLVPQMNVFVMSIPAKIAAGTIVTVLAIPAVVLLFGTVVEDVMRMIFALLRAF